MGIVNIQQTLTSLSAVDATIIANTITETSLFPIVNGTPGLPAFASFTLGEGSCFALSMGGKFSNRASAPGSITLRAKLGGVLVWSSGALNFPASLKTDNTFQLDVTFMVRPGSKIMGVGSLLSSIGLLMLPATAPADSAVFDPTVSNDFDVTGQFSVADPGNKIQMLNCQIVY